MQLYDELPIVFPFYNKLEKQNRFRENAKKSCDYELISPRNALLPFQLKVPNLNRPVSWQIFSLGGFMEIDISNNIDTLSAKGVEDGVYIIYNGMALSFVAGSVTSELKIPKGKYYTAIGFSDGTRFFSELFMVPESSFRKEEDGKFIKIEFSNSCDIAPVMYPDGFVQNVYLDSFIHASEPEIEEDGERDGDDQLVPTFQKMLVRYRISVVIPDFLKIALMSMQIHDNVYLTTEDGTRRGKIERVTATSTIDNDGAFSTVDMVLEQVVMVKNACCDNILVTSESPWI